MIAPAASTSSAPLIDLSLFGRAESLSEDRKTAPSHPRRTETVRPTEADKFIPRPPHDPSDFLWLMTEEPHRSRRQAILRAHPEVLRFPASNRPILPKLFSLAVYTGHEADGLRAFD
ncbi:hypothetical protein FRC08_014039 [Ceratobasidium sp. 394]|nr:hypothetical protein FRC08_014039 [Ceratobasidium sp. 394]KAG9090314.1 hypothetical protein FS749_000652 [Ceratobasidium sp. UAMH 11750]